MTATSFATAADFAPTAIHADIWTAPRRKPVPAKKALSTRFGPAARKPANDRAGKKGGADGMLGSMILEGLFFAVFPGLSATFHGLNALDAVDLYDTARDAVRRNAPTSPMGMAVTRARRHGEFGPMNAAIMARPRRRSLLALALG